MAKNLSLVINTQIDLSKAQVVEMIASVLSSHYVASLEVDDGNGNGVASQAHAWATVAEVGGLHELLSELHRKTLQEAVDIMFPNPMSAQTFRDLLTALNIEDMTAMVLNAGQQASLLKWAMLRIGDAVAAKYEELLKESELERKGRALMMQQRAADTLKEGGWELQPPTHWHGERRRGSRSDRRKSKKE